MLQTQSTTSPPTTVLAILPSDIFRGTSTLHPPELTTTKQPTTPNLPPHPKQPAQHTDSYDPAIIDSEEEDILNQVAEIIENNLAKSIADHIDNLAM